MWNNRIFDQAFDAVGLRQSVEILSGAQAGETIQAKFERPQEIVLDGLSHTTEYSIEYTTSEGAGIDHPTRLKIGNQTFRVRNKPRSRGDGYWTVALLEELR